MKPELTLIQPSSNVLFTRQESLQLPSNTVLHEDREANCTSFSPPVANDHRGLLRLASVARGTAPHRSQWAFDFVCKSSCEGDQRPAAQRLVARSVIANLASDDFSPDAFELVYGPSPLDLGGVVRTAASMMQQQRAAKGAKAPDIATITMGPYLRFQQPREMHELVQAIVATAQRQPCMVLFIDIDADSAGREARCFLNHLQERVLSGRLPHPLAVIATSEGPWELNEKILACFKHKAPIGLPPPAERRAYLVRLLDVCTGGRWGEDSRLDQIVERTALFALDELKRAVLQAASRGIARAGDTELAERLVAQYWDYAGQPGFRHLPVMLADVLDEVATIVPVMDSFQSKFESFEARLVQGGPSASVHQVGAGSPQG